MRHARLALPALVLGLLLLVGCVRDQQTARTRIEGVDKKPDPEQYDEEKPPAKRGDEEETRNG